MNSQGEIGDPGIGVCDPFRWKVSSCGILAELNHSTTPSTDGLNGVENANASRFKPNMNVAYQG